MTITSESISNICELSLNTIYFTVILLISKNKKYSHVLNQLHFCPLVLRKKLTTYTKKKKISIWSGNQVVFVVSLVLERIYDQFH